MYPAENVRARNLHATRTTASASGQAYLVAKIVNASTAEMADPIPITIHHIHKTFVWT